MHDVRTIGTLVRRRLNVVFVNSGVTADLDPPRIWTPRSRSASGYGPPLADLDPSENKRSIEQNW